jgi:hypothetical protein
MILTSSSRRGAIINLSLGVKGGAQIQNKLYTLECELYIPLHAILSFLHLSFDKVELDT